MGAKLRILLQIFKPYPQQWKLTNEYTVLIKMLIYVMNNRLASYLDKKFLRREPTQQFLHDMFTMGSSGENKEVTIFLSSVCM